jgi:beta-glucanase (GH16 family)
MKYSVILFAMLAACTNQVNKNSNQAENKSATDSALDKWELVWEDNFEGTGLPDTTIWGYEEGFVRNREAQFYTRARTENARMEGGNLVIEARNDNWNGNKITSASINTKSKKSILYGRVEVRAKLPTGLGTWPAIWMLGENISDIGWPACGEIDIMENVGFDPDLIHANIHTKAYNHVMKTNKGNRMSTEKPYEKFNIYALDWYEDHMDFFLNDSLYFSFKNEGTGNDAWPFDKPHYLLINLAVGGAWGGQKGIDDSIFPQKYFVDYVRVFREKK